MLRHIVLFKFKSTASPSDRDGLKTMLEALPSQIDVIREFQVGYDIVRAARSYDMGLVSVFDNKAGLDVYSPHPAHLPVVDKARELCESVVSVDFDF